MAEFHRRHESHADQSVMTSSLARSRIMTSGGRVKQRALQPFRRARECAPLRMQNASVMRRCERGGRLDDTSRQRSYPDRLWSARHDQRWDSRMRMSRDCGFRKAQGRASIEAHRGSAWLAHGLDIGAGRSTQWEEDALHRKFLLLFLAGPSPGGWRGVPSPPDRTCRCQAVVRAPRCVGWLPLPWPCIRDACASRLVLRTYPNQKAVRRAATRRCAALCRPAPIVMTVAM